MPESRPTFLWDCQGITADDACHLKRSFIPASHGIEFRLSAKAEKIHDTADSEKPAGEQVEHAHPGVPLIEFVAAESP